jgi:hypothetical protein
MRRVRRQADRPLIIVRGWGRSRREWLLPRTPLCFSVFKGLESWYIDGQAKIWGSAPTKETLPHDMNVVPSSREAPVHVNG